MFRNLNVPKNNINNNTKVKDIIKNKKLDYDSIKNLVSDAPNKYTSQMHKSNNHQRLLK